MPANAVKLFGLVSYFVFILKRLRPWNFNKLITGQKNQHENWILDMVT